jgi:hypothetical protein
MQLKWTNKGKPRPPKPSEIGVRGDWRAEKSGGSAILEGAKLNLGRTDGQSVSDCG